MAKKEITPLSGDNVRELRRKHGLNQSQFWAKIGVTQSGGSRYESGRNIPRPVQALIHIAYGSEKQLQKTLHDLRPSLKNAA